MKREWQTRPLGQLLQVQNGFAFDSKLFDADTGTPLIRIRDLKGGAGTTARFTGEFDDRYLVKTGDLLIGMDGDFGCYEWRGEPALLNQRVCRLQGFTSDLHPRFLLYGVNSHLKAIEEVTGFTTVKHLSSRQVLSIEFPMPPRAEQQRIVAILDNAFEAVATARANAEKNVVNARAIFESYLDTVFTQRGEGWSDERVGEIALHSLGKMLDKAKNKGELRPYLRNANVRWFDFDLSDVHQMPFLPEEMSRYTAVKGDVVICEGGYPGRAAIWAEDSPIYFQKAVHRVRFPEPVQGEWFLYYLYSLDRSGVLKRYFTGTGIQHLTGQTLHRLEIPMPPLPEIRAAVARFDELSSEVRRLESMYQRKLAALDALKQSLLHHAFSGQL